MIKLKKDVTYKKLIECGCKLNPNGSYVLKNGVLEIYIKQDRTVCGIGTNPISDRIIFNSFKQLGISDIIEFV